MEAGAVPTWISYKMHYNFTEVHAWVRNLSGQVSAVNAQIALYASLFGIGTPRGLVSIQRLNFAPGQEIRIIFPLPQALTGSPDSDNFTNGNSGWHIRIEHPFDQVRINNRGSLTARGVFVHKDSGVFKTSFPVYNNSNSVRLINLNVLQNELDAVIQPASRQFAPMEQFSASLTLNPLLAVAGKQVSVVGRLGDGTLIEGLTYIVL